MQVVGLDKTNAFGLFAKGIDKTRFPLLSDVGVLNAIADFAESQSLEHTEALLVIMTARHYGFTHNPAFIDFTYKHSPEETLEMLAALSGGNCGDTKKQ